MKELSRGLAGAGLYTKSVAAAISMIVISLIVAVWLSSAPTEPKGLDQLDLATIDTVTVDIRGGRAEIVVVGQDTPLELSVAQDFVGVTMWPIDEPHYPARVGREVLAIQQTSNGRWVMRRWVVIKSVPGLVSTHEPVYESRPDPPGGWPVFCWQSPTHSTRVPDPLAELVVYRRAR